MQYSLTSTAAYTDWALTVWKMNFPMSLHKNQILSYRSTLRQSNFAFMTNSIYIKVYWYESFVNFIFKCCSTVIISIQQRHHLFIEKGVSIFLSLVAGFITASCEAADIVFSYDTKVEDHGCYSLMPPKIHYCPLIVLSYIILRNHLCEFWRAPDH